MVLEERQPQWTDCKLVFFFALAFPVARLLLDSFVYQRLAKRRPQLSMDVKLRVKVTESMWKLTYYSAAEVFAYFAIVREPWFGNSVAYWDNWPNQTIKLQLRLFYTFQCGFYIYSVVALLVWETRRKDFLVMMSHHIVTIVLISTSFMAGFFRAGSLVIALHDASDVLLESAKLMKYSGRDVGASVFFGLFALSWFLLRLVYFPFWMIWTTSYQCMSYVDFKQRKMVILYYCINSLLMSLLVIHVYWWVLICRMMLKQLQNNGKVGQDVRSDDEED